MEHDASGRDIVSTPPNVTTWRNWLDDPHDTFVSLAASAGKTASAPSGTGAPVMTRTAWPGWTGWANGRAGSASPTIFKSMGLYALAAKVSAPCKA